MIQNLLKHLKHNLCLFLALLAPLIIENTACLYYWGEPDIPEDLFD